jgi:hypothetical protein
MRTWLWILLLLPWSSYAQINIDKAGDGWHLKVDSAIQLIKETDYEKAIVLDSVCKKIEFWQGGFSTNEGSYGNKGTILISVKDVKLNSINNLAAVLVHESLHLLFLKKGMVLSPGKEEMYCYRYELEFLLKLKDPEPWLIQHANYYMNQTAK